MTVNEAQAQLLRVLKGASEKRANTRLVKANLEIQILKRRIRTLEKQELESDIKYKMLYLSKLRERKELR